MATRPRRRSSAGLPPLARIADALAALAGLSKDALAVAVGVSRVTLYRARLGQTRLDPAQEARWADALRCDVRVLQGPTDALAKGAERLTRAELPAGALFWADGVVRTAGPDVPPGVRLSPAEYAALYPAIETLERDAAKLGVGVVIAFTRSPSRPQLPTLGHSNGRK